MERVDMTKINKIMPKLQILSKEEIKIFNSAPRFNKSEKEKYFGTDYQIGEIIGKFNNSSNKVGFILLHGTVPNQQH
jgi:hypothetical protein